MCLEPDAVTWLCDTDPDLGDTDDAYDDATDPDDLTSALAEGEAFIDDDSPTVTYDENGCVNYCEASILCYTDSTASPPKTKKKRTIRLRHIHLTKKRIKKIQPKPQKPGAGGSG